MVVFTFDLSVWKELMGIQSTWTYCLLVVVISEVLVPAPEVRVLLVPADVPAVADQPPLCQCSSRLLSQALSCH